MIQLGRRWGCLLLSCLWLVVGVVCVQECFVDHLLVFRPLDPFTFQNEPFHACCQFVERKDFTVANVSFDNVTLVFSCSGDASDKLSTTTVTPVDGQYDGKDELSPHAFCSDLTVQPGPTTTCRCKVAGWPRCNAHQAVTVDVPLPNELIFDCIAYGTQNLTCKPDVPQFFHPARVTTTISWSQVGNPFVQQKICAQYDSCVVTPSDDHMLFSMLVILNVSMTLEYVSASGFQGSGEQDDVVKIASWKKVDLEISTMLKTVTPIVDGVKATSLSLNGQVKNVFSDKTVHISYTSLDPWSDSQGLQEIHMDILTSDLSTTLVDLSPFTKYSVCMSAKTVKSDLWSHPGCVEVTTDPDVPASSPKTMEDAFCILDSSTVLVYWKPLQEWKWNSPLKEGRKYIGQEVANADWTKGPAVNWTLVETTVEVWGPHGDGMDFWVLAVNSLGRAVNESRVIRIPKEKDIIQGPKDIKAVFESSKKMVNITWKLDDVDVQSTVFWCQQGLKQHICLNSFDWVRPVRKGENSVSIPVNSVQEARQYMYGVALSKTKGTGQQQSSGIHWQKCVLVMDGNSTNEEGDCDRRIEKNDSSDQDSRWIIAWIIAPVVMGIACLTCCIYYCCRRRRIKREEFKRMLPVTIQQNGDVGRDHDGYEQFPNSGSSGGSQVELLRCYNGDLRSVRGMSGLDMHQGNGTPLGGGSVDRSVAIQVSNGGQSEAVGHKVDGGGSGVVGQEVGGGGNDVEDKKVSVNLMDEGMNSGGNAFIGGDVSNDNVGSGGEDDGNVDSGDDGGGDADGNLDSGGVGGRSGPGSNYKEMNKAHGGIVTVNDGYDGVKEYMWVGQENEVGSSIGPLVELLPLQKVSVNSMAEGMIRGGNTFIGGDVSNDNVGSGGEADGNSDSDDVGGDVSNDNVGSGGEADGNSDSDNDGDDADGNNDIDSSGVDIISGYEQRNRAHGLTVIVNNDCDDISEKYMRVGRENESV